MKKQMKSMKGHGRQSLVELDWTTPSCFFVHGCHNSAVSWYNNDPADCPRQKTHQDLRSGRCSELIYGIRSEFFEDIAR